MPKLTNIRKVTFLGVRDLAPDYREIARTLAGENVAISNEATFDPQRRGQEVDDPKVIVSKPLEIADSIVERANRESDTFFIFSTSTVNTPMFGALALANIKQGFGLIEHSPDGTTLRVYVIKDHQEREVWNQETRGREEGAGASR